MPRTPLIAQRRRLASILSGSIPAPLPVKDTAPKTSDKTKSEASKVRAQVAAIAAGVSDPNPAFVTRERRMEEHWVTAAIAEDWLASSGKNRKVDGRDVVKYSKVMTRDDWDDFHPEGLIFDWDGRLIDGRHRLAAVMRAAETEGENFRVGFVCMLGFDPETKVTTNTGRARTMAQTSQIIGQDATAAELAIVKALWIKPSPAHSRVPRVTDYQEVFSTYDKFKEGIQLAAKKSTGRGGVSVACVRAVLARAFYHYPAPESLERLKRFIYVLDTGLSENEEEFPAVLIRNAYMNQTKPGTAGTLELYRKTLYAVDAYMKGNTIKSLRQLKTQPFPLKDLEPDKED